MDDKRFDKNLLSDEEFTELMDAEFAAQGKPVDVLSKKKVWEKVQTAVKGELPQDPKPPVADNSWRVGIALAACVFLSVTISVVRPWISDDTGIKGLEDAIPVDLLTYTFSKNRQDELIVADFDTLQPPAVLVPRVLVSQPVYVALLRLEGGGVPRVVVREQFVAAGEEVEFAKDDEQVFAVDWTGAERLIYCVVAFVQREELAAQLLLLEEAKEFAFDGNCALYPRVEP